MNKKRLVIALAGNANVGKSVIFNHLTGMHQHIGNWPGKTVEKAEGTLHFQGYTIDVIDLPGIYSLSTFSLEELISREYIAIEKPDLVINVVDASVLERNLFFTLQLIELETPMVIALNQMDIAKRKGIQIDHKMLEEALGVPVVPTIAPNQTGLYELLVTTIDFIEKGGLTPKEMKYGEEVEAKIETLSKVIEKLQLPYGTRWTTIKLLEGDERIESRVKTISPETLNVVRSLRAEIEGIHGHSCSTVITSERYEMAGCIAREVQVIVPPEKPPVAETLHSITTHRMLGYPIMIAAILLTFLGIFVLGDYASSALSNLFYSLEPLIRGLFGTGPVGELIWGGIIEGLIAGTAVALPYLLPFYLVLYLLEDSGYLSRIAFLMDNVMHRIGLHGKAFIPMMLGFGCNVPACLGCRIMETERERLLAIFVVTLVPCAATSVIILGLVGAYVGVEWALMLYVINMLLVLILGRIAFKTLPGEPTGLIMEMHDYRLPHSKTVVTQTFFRLKEFVKMAFPLIIAGSLVIKSVELLGLLDSIAEIMSPITVNWLGLPAVTGIALIFGVLRKELSLVMLATLLGTSNFSQVPEFGPIQMIVFTLVAMLYIPCISTIAALVKELGWKKAWVITVFEVSFALIAGGIAFRLLTIANIW
ncbi:ferrous iron transport protein B [Candidatus Bathyarchaeota archaeon]|nr:ferrous iron transport protein B [Candidatus Bathyarchaeota archaeon]